MMQLSVQIMRSVCTLQEYSSDQKRQEGSHNNNAHFLSNRIRHPFVFGSGATAKTFWGDQFIVRRKQKLDSLVGDY